MHYTRPGMVTMGPRLTPAVKYIILACVGIYFLSALGAGREMIYFFGLTPHSVFTKLFIWQPLTYLFFHAGFGHIFWNMFALWMFGSEMERYLGSREFVRFFFITGAGAGLLSIAVHPMSAVPTVGASGSIYGILLAYGMLFPERMVYLYFLFPIKVKYFISFVFVVAFFSAFGSSGTGIDHFAHLGGGLFAFLYLKGFLSWKKIRESYYRWRLQRLRRKFKVYENERRKRDDDFWIN